jgi:hypothetical protein
MSRQLNADVLLSSICSSSEAAGYWSNRTDLLDGIPQLVKLLEDCHDLRHQFFVHDQLATVRLAVETDVVDADQHRLDNCCWTVSGRRARNTARFPPGEWSVQRPDAETKAMFSWEEGSVCLMTRFVIL